jgi:hypothetical protein
MEGTFIDGKYQVLRQLGQGGMGAVYEARHKSTGRKVAVKVIVPAALAGGVDIIARFQREARASGSIDSPFVVQVFDASRRAYRSTTASCGCDRARALAASRSLRRRELRMTSQASFVRSPSSIGRPR